MPCGVHSLTHSFARSTSTHAVPTRVNAVPGKGKQGGRTELASAPRGWQPGGWWERDSQARLGGGWPPGSGEGRRPGGGRRALPPHCPTRGAGPHSPQVRCSCPFSPFVLSLDWRKRERTAHPVVITGQSGGFVKLAFHLGKKKGGATPRRSTSELVQSSGLEIRGAASSGSGSGRPPRAHLRPCCSRWAEASPCFSFSGTVTHPLTHKHPPKRHTHVHQTAGGAHSQK